MAGQAGGLRPDENRSNIDKLYRATRCGHEFGPQHGEREPGWFGGRLADGLGSESVLRAHVTSATAGHGAGRRHAGRRLVPHGLFGISVRLGRNLGSAFRSLPQSAQTDLLPRKVEDRCEKGSLVPSLTGRQPNEKLTRFSLEMTRFISAGSPPPRSRTAC